MSALAPRARVGTGGVGGLGAGVLWGAVLGVPALVVGVGVFLHLARGGFGELSPILGTQTRLLANTLVYGAATTVLASGLGWILAHVQHHYRFVGRRLLHWLAFAPLVMPSFIFAMALVIVFGHNGWLAQSVGTPVEVYGLGGLIVAGTLARLPYAYLVLLAAHRGIHRDVIGAAAGLGIGPVQRLRVVSWPRVRVPLLGVVLLIFADTVADLANPLVVGGSFRVVASRLYEAVTGEGDLAAASAYALLLLVPALAALLATRRRDARPGLLTGRDRGGLGLAPGVRGRVLLGVALVGGGLRRGPRPGGRPGRDPAAGFGTVLGFVRRVGVGPEPPGPGLVGVHHRDGRAGGPAGGAGRDARCRALAALG